MRTEYYTYRIRWSSTGMSYYGVRYKAGSKTTDLMTTYFTSSKYVHEYIRSNGLPDIVEIRKTFSDALSAKQWEERVISRGKLYLSDNWLNAGNNGSFKNTIMTEQIKNSISKSKKSKHSKYHSYNNGIIEIRLHPNESPPEGFVRGVLMTESRQSHVTKLRNLHSTKTEEEKKAISEKLSIALRGKSKPEGFGEKVSLASKGKPKPWNLGENNPSKRQESRKKISDSRKTREPIRWFHNDNGETMWCYLSDIESVDMAIWHRGKPAKGKWYNDGVRNYYICDDSDISGLTAGKIKINYVVCTNGISNTKVRSIEEIPEGWWQGKTQKTKKKGSYKYINDGHIMKCIDIDQELPEGFTYGKLKRNTK